MSSFLVRIIVFLHHKKEMMFEVNIILPNLVKIGTHRESPSLVTWITFIVEKKIDRRQIQLDDVYANIFKYKLHI
jgi:hypothetical protein